MLGNARLSRLLCVAVQSDTRWLNRRVLINRPNKRALGLHHSIAGFAHSRIRLFFHAPDNKQKVAQVAISLWPFFFLIMNLPERMRHHAAYVIFHSMATSAGCKQPLNFNTHNELVLEDLLIGWTLGFEIVVNGQPTLIRVMMLFLICDYPV